MSLTHSARLSCLLLDDHLPALQLMEDTLKAHYPQLQLSTCTTLDEADQAYHQHLPALLILDINLPDGNCFSWLRKITAGRTAAFSVIFITAHADHAIEAFRFSAIDFLLKPYHPQELVNAVNKAFQHISNRFYQQQLEVFFHNHEHTAKEEKQIVLKTLEEIHIVPVRDILALEADNSYTRFSLKDGRSILVSQPIKEYEQQLSHSGFLRVHQSHLVNLKYIRAYRKKNSLLVLETDLQVPVSQHKKAQLMAYLNQLSG